MQIFYKHTIPDIDGAGVSQRERLTEQLDKGVLECLVCCERIRQIDSVWSCNNCFHVLHLKCVKKWAKSSITGISSIDFEFIKHILSHQRFQRTYGGVRLVKITIPSYRWSIGASAANKTTRNGRAVETVPTRAGIFAAACPRDVCVIRAPFCVMLDHVPNVTPS